MSKGLDHADGVTPPRSDVIKATGHDFVLRYCSGSLDPFWTKCMRAAELQDLWNHGINVGYNFERGDGRDTLLGGYDSGARWATAQKQVNRQVGWDDSWPIIVSADWDFTLGGPTRVDPPSPGEMNCRRIAEFQRGWAQVLAEPGLYGGYWCLQAVKRLRPQLTIGWQTIAWSLQYGNHGPVIWHDWAHLQQVNAVHWVDGHLTDLDIATGPNTGLRAHNQPPPTDPFAGWPVLGQHDVAKPAIVSAGPYVGRWQRILNAIFSRSPVSALKGLTPLAADSVFGPQTADRTKVLQRIGNLTQDGIAGPHTYTAAAFFATLEKIDVRTV